MIYRRFGYARTRVLLYLQDTLRDLEQQLDDEDYQSALRETTRQELCNRQRDDWSSTSQRKDIYAKLTAHLKTYGKYDPVADVEIH